MRTSRDHPSGPGPGGLLTLNKVDSMARRPSATAAPNQVKGGPVVPRAMPFDVVIRGGLVVDGTGAPWRRADIGTRGAKIGRVGDIGRSKSAVVIDASGKYVAPGFIDIHTHSDLGILVEPTAECAVRQGVTTHVIGNCGDSPAPISERYRELAMRRLEYYAQARDWTWPTYGGYIVCIMRQRAHTNIPDLTSHQIMELARKGSAERALAPDPLQSMKDHVDEARSEEH